MHYTVDEGLGILTIDDGQVNAMSQSFFDDLNAALDGVESTPPSALVIAGRPGVFSAGLNIKLLPTLPPDALRSTLVSFGRTMLRLFAFPLPTVAAVTGHAIAGGSFLAFGCDLRVMADGPFRLQVNEVAIGLAVPTWANAIVESVVDVRWRVETVLHARPYSPGDALARGFVTDVSKPEKVIERARELATPLGRLGRASYATTKGRTRALAVKHAEATLEVEIVGPFGPGPQG